MNIAIHMAIRITLNLRVNWPIFHNDMSDHNSSDYYTRTISENIKLTYLLVGKWSTSVQNVYLSYQKMQKPNNNKPRRVPPISSQINVSQLKSDNTFRGTHSTYCSIFSLNYTFQFCYYRIELKDIPHKKCQSVHHLHNREISQNSVGCRVVEAVLTSQASIYRFFVDLQS